MQIASGVTMLKVSIALGEGTGAIYPTLLRDGETAILVDTGFPGQLDAVRAAMGRAGVSFDRLGYVILTHHDIDHIGGLREIRATQPAVRVLASAAEKAYIQGEKVPIKLAQMAARLASMSADQQAFYEKMSQAFQNNFSPVDKALVDGEELPYLGGVRVIDTPGHTQGHICLYLVKSKTLIAGDALRVENGELTAPPPALNADQEISQASLRKLADYDVAAVICYHGGLFRDEPNQHIAELARGEA